MRSAVSIQVPCPRRTEVRTVTHPATHSLDVAKQTGYDRKASLFCKKRVSLYLFIFLSFSFFSFLSLPLVPLPEVLCCAILFFGIVSCYAPCKPPLLA